MRSLTAGDVLMSFIDTYRSKFGVEQICNVLQIGSLVTGRTQRDEMLDALEQALYARRSSVKAL